MELISNKYVKPQNFKLSINSPNTLAYTTNAPDISNVIFEKHIQVFPPGQKESTTLPFVFKSNGQAKPDAKSNVSINLENGTISGMIYPADNPKIRYKLTGVYLPQYGEMQGIVETLPSPNGPNIGRFILYKAPN
jgi:hypothetical protein